MCKSSGGSCIDSLSWASDGNGELALGSHRAGEVVGPGGGGLNGWCLSEGIPSLGRTSIVCVVVCVSCGCLRGYGYD